MEILSIANAANVKNNISLVSLKTVFAYISKVKLNKIVDNILAC